MPLFNPFMGKRRIAQRKPRHNRHFHLRRLNRHAEVIQLGNTGLGIISHHLNAMSPLRPRLHTVGKSNPSPILNSFNRPLQRVSASEAKHRIHSVPCERP
jgi:hypothetical protein